MTGLGLLGKEPAPPRSAPRIALTLAQARPACGTPRGNCNDARVRAVRSITAATRSSGPDRLRPLKFVECGQDPALIRGMLKSLEGYRPVLRSANVGHASSLGFAVVVVHDRHIN